MKAMGARSRSAFLGALVLSLVAAPAMASGPSLYAACGIPEVGTPTRDQLLCVAEAIGVPADPKRRIVRRGFNESFGEATLEVLHEAAFEFPSGGSATFRLKLALSEIDGQVLSYGGAFEPITLDAKGPDRVSLRLARLCGWTDDVLVDATMATCMARALGMTDGTRGLSVREQDQGHLQGLAWVVENTLAERPCDSYGLELEVSAHDGRVLRYGLVEGSCAHGPEPKRPIVRAARQP
jgi:hypothetical protein